MSLQKFLDELKETIICALIYTMIFMAIFVPLMIILRIYSFEFYEKLIFVLKWS